MTMINRVLNRIPEENSDLPAGMNTWPDCNPGDWFSPAVQEATNSHAFQYKTGNYGTWTGMNKNPTGPGMSTDIGQNSRNTHIGCCS